MIYTDAVGREERKVGKRIEEHIEKLVGEGTILRGKVTSVTMIKAGRFIVSQDLVLSTEKSVAFHFRFKVVRGENGKRDVLIREGG